MPADRPQLLRIGPVEQLRAGRLPRRLVQLFVGLTLFGVSTAMQIRAGLGLNPWDVFHQGVARHLPLTFGTVVVLTSFVVLLLWIPLRTAPGLGTIANAIWVGLSADVALRLLPAPTEILSQAALLAAAVILNGLAGGLYIGSQLGPGPRDGLMTGLHHRTGRSLRGLRTGIEVVVLAVGWALGGSVGIGTLLYAILIGPIVQFFLHRCTVRLTPPPPRPGR